MSPIHPAPLSLVLQLIPDSNDGFPHTSGVQLGAGYLWMLVSDGTQLGPSLLSGRRLAGGRDTSLIMQVHRHGDAWVRMGDA